MARQSIKWATKPCDANLRKGTPPTDKTIVTCSTKRFHRDEKKYKVKNYMHLILRIVLFHKNSIIVLIRKLHELKEHKKIDPHLPKLGQVVYQRVAFRLRHVSNNEQ